MPTLRDYDYIIKKAAAWGRECHQTKLCLFEILIQAAKEELNQGEQPDFVMIKAIAREYGFIGMYNEAIKKVEKDIP